MLLILGKEENRNMQTASRELLESLIELVAEELGITPPRLHMADGSHTTTKKAWIKMPAQELFIKPNLPLNEAVLVVAHELRHLYQLENGRYTDELGDADNYIDSGENTTLYALQACEVDANAFAEIVCESVLGLRPLWKPYPQEVKKAIAKRKQEILRDEYD